MAEVCSWWDELTADAFLQATENSLWLLAAALAVAAFLALMPRLNAAGWRFVVAAAVGGAVYVLFMAVVDVPMYLAR